MKKQRLLTCLGVFILSLVANVGFAQIQDEAQDFYELSLEELLSYDVSSATKSAMTVQKAPSVIRMFTKEDFEKFGFTTLQDVLNTIPGIQVQEYRAGHQLVWIRGVQARYNNKVLMLVDGVPMRDSYYGNFNIDEMFPIESIEKIEVLNGPGSVLYGANSFSGVISITTKKEGRSVGADYGTFNTVSAHAEYSADNLYAHGNFYHTDGFQPDYMTDGLSRDVNQNANGQFGLVKYSGENLSASLGVANYGYPYKYRDTKKEYYFNRMPIFGSVKFGQDISESTRINVNTYTNYYKFNRDKIKYVSSDADDLSETSDNPLNTMLTGVDIDLSYNSAKHSLVTGVSWQLDNAFDIHENITFSQDPADIGREEVLSNPNVSRHSVGLFAQETYAINDIYNVTVGVRYDILSAFDNQFNYRAGITANYQSGLYSKLLYGTAYRVPSYREYLTLEAPNAELTPEKLNTLEFQLGYLINSKADINLTLFNNNYQDFIQEIVVDSVDEGGGVFRIVDDEMAFNWESRSITGIELNSNIRPSNEFSINIGMSYFIKATETAGELPTNIYTGQTVEPDEVDIVFLSPFSAFTNIQYTIAENYSIGLNAGYYGDRNVPDEYQSESNIQQPSNADGFTKLDLVLGARFMESKLRFNVKISNLTNADIYSPPYGGASGYDIQWPGTTFRIGARYLFNN